MLNIPKSKIRVAWLHPVIPNYRVPLIKRLALNGDIEIDYYHGQEKSGYSVRSAGTVLPKTNVLIRNIFWPFSGKIFWQTAVKKIFSGHYDLVILPDLIHNLSIWVLWLIMVIRNRPFALFGTDYPANTEQGTLKFLTNFLKKPLRKSASSIMVYTERDRRKYSQLGTVPQKIFVCNNTLDTEYLSSIEATLKFSELENIRKHYNLTGRPVLLYVGRLLSVKRVDVLIDTFRELQMTTLNPVLLIVGEGLDFEQLYEHAKGLSDVHFLGGIYDERELAKIFLVSDLLVIPGRIGLTCIHGFCYGVPSVTTSHGIEQSPEFDYIRDKENGILIKELKVSMYTKALYSLFSDPKYFSKLKFNATQTAKQLSMSYTASQIYKAIQFSVAKL